MDYDLFLSKHLGQFGRFNLKVLCLLTVLTCFNTFSSSGHLFMAARIRSRCLIPECDERNPEYSTPWILNAIPGSSTDALEQCTRYRNSNTSGMLDNRTCFISDFDKSTSIKCENGNVYENTNSIVYDFDLGCSEWYRALVGIIRTIGTFLGISLWGNLADHWGRKSVLLFGQTVSPMVGIIKYWATSYYMYVGLEFFEAFVEAGIFPCIFILFLELTGPDYREVASGCILSLLSVGGVALGIIAWTIQKWRNMILVVYIPQVTVLAFYWLLPESPRWLLTKGRYEEAEVIIKKAAEINKKVIPDSVLLELRKGVKIFEKENEMKKLTKEKEPWLIVTVFRNKSLLLRCTLAPVWWLSTVFIHNGLGVNAVNLAGNSYLNFIISEIVDLPGFISAIFFMRWYGRRKVLATCLIVCALCQIAYIFVDIGNYNLNLALYFFGKFVVSISGVCIYAYTSELFPTKYRQSLFTFSSMMGRFGSVLAYLTPALSATVWINLPSAMYIGMGLISSFLIFLTPETKNTNLPDTVDEAISLEKKKDDPEKPTLSTTN